jgi:hypothetical protein
MSDAGSLRVVVTLVFGGACAAYLRYASRSRLMYDRSLLMYDRSVLAYR